MQCICPKCGRKNNISISELKIQNGNVVCPRCLTVTKVEIPPALQDEEENDATPPPIPAARKKSPTATQSSTQSMTPPPVQYCRHCGTRLPAGKTACPKCGTSASGGKGSTSTSSAASPQQPRRTISFVQQQPPSTARNKRNAAHKRKTVGKNSGKGFWSYWSSKNRTWGCMGFTVLTVAVFFMLYYLIGSLFNS